MGKYLVTYDFTTDNYCEKYYDRIIAKFDKYFRKSDMRNIWISDFTSEETKKMLAEIEQILEEELSTNCFKSLKIIAVHCDCIYKLNTNI